MLESHFSNKKKRTGEPSISAHQDVWSRLRDDVALKLRKSVVSLVLKNACRIPSIFSGIAIECHNNVTKFVTTGILARALQTGHFDEEIKVYCEGCVVKGYLDEYDSDRQLAVVKVMCALDVICVDLDHGMECKPRKQLIAVCRLFDTLHISSGEISYKSEDRAFLVFSPSFKNWLGAAFFDFGGKFVGMNHSHLLPSKITLERSKPGRVFRYVGMNGWYETIRGEHYFHPEAYDIFDKEQFRHLSALGYPIPSRSMVNRGFILVRTFENPFGDVYPKGVWGEFRKRVSSEISRNVVALASFKGETRIFACTGVFIDFDDKNPKILTSASLVRDPDDIYKTVEGLRIEVLLPSKQCGMGTLQHCSLHYNVAIVNVENYRSVCPMNLERGPVNHNSYMLKATTVVAVGRIFQSGALMAASGKLCAGSGILNCNALCYSTCKITKAGIGGPLVDFDGNFVGMNFHGMSHCCKKIGTPLLYREELCRILEFLKTNKTMKFSWGGSIIEDRAPINNWPVPAPYWCDPSDLEEDHMNDKRELEPDGRRVRYSCGSITMLK